MISRFLFTFTAKPSQKKKEGAKEEELQALWREAPQQEKNRMVL